MSDTIFTLATSLLMVLHCYLTHEFLTSHHRVQPEPTIHPTLRSCIRPPSSRQGHTSQQAQPVRDPNINAQLNDAQSRQLTRIKLETILTTIIGARNLISELEVKSGRRNIAVQDIETWIARLKVKSEESGSVIRQSEIVKEIEELEVQSEAVRIEEYEASCLRVSVEVNLLKLREEAVREIEAL